MVPPKPKNWLQHVENQTNDAKTAVDRINIHVSSFASFLFGAAPPPKTISRNSNDKKKRAVGRGEPETGPSEENILAMLYLLLLHDM